MPDEMDAMAFAKFVLENANSNIENRLRVPVGLEIRESQAFDAHAAAQSEGYTIVISTAVLEAVVVTLASLVTTWTPPLRFEPTMPIVAGVVVPGEEVRRILGRETSVVDLSSYSVEQRRALTGLLLPTLDFVFFHEFMHIVNGHVCYLSRLHDVELQEKCGPISDKRLKAFRTVFELHADAMALVALMLVVRAGAYNHVLPDTNDALDALFLGCGAVYQIIDAFSWVLRPPEVRFQIFLRDDPRIHPHPLKRAWFVSNLILGTDPDHQTARRFRDSFLTQVNEMSRVWSRSGLRDLYPRQSDDEMHRFALDLASGVQHGTVMRDPQLYIDEMNNVLMEALRTIEDIGCLPRTPGWSAPGP
jgi:hypothetical protein